MLVLHLFFFILLEATSVYSDIQIPLKLESMNVNYQMVTVWEPAYFKSKSSCSSYIAFVNNVIQWRQIIIYTLSYSSEQWTPPGHPRHVTVCIHTLAYSLTFAELHKIYGILFPHSHVIIELSDGCFCNFVGKNTCCGGGGRAKATVVITGLLSPKWVPQWWWLQSCVYTFCIVQKCAIHTIAMSQNGHITLVYNDILSNISYTFTVPLPWG